MIKYISQKQLSIEEFRTPFHAKLLENNRWVQLSKVVPWDKFASAYMSMMTTDFGRPGEDTSTLKVASDNVGSPQLLKRWE
ncbi:MAG: hypothetical protein B6I32_09200 [Desulfobacterium sp. 4572_20]|nr:MAG: hypothetical protein B6I32_09200 [Desulfobacterium sp. 4572_20]